jgi:hypothetical protein
MTFGHLDNRTFGYRGTSVCSWSLEINLVLVKEYSPCRAWAHRVKVSVTASHSSTFVQCGKTVDRFPLKILRSLYPVAGYQNLKKTPDPVSGQNKMAGYRVWHAIWRPDTEAWKNGRISSLTLISDQEIFIDTEFDSISGGRIPGSKCTPFSERILVKGPSYTSNNHTSNSKIIQHTKHLADKRMSVVG